MEFGMLEVRCDGRAVQVLTRSRVGTVPQDLVAEVKRLSEDDAAYEERMAWRYKAVHEWPEVLQDIRHRSLAGPSKCQLCQLVALRRVAGSTNASFVEN
jgi:hypothetical protein